MPVGTAGPPNAGLSQSLFGHDGDAFALQPIPALHPAVVQQPSNAASL
jgi:hypothetical protein